jgi:hypothetical protein
MAQHKGLPAIRTPRSGVLEIDGRAGVTQRELLRLVSGEVVAAQVHDFLSREECAHLRSRLEHAAEVTPHDDVPGMRVVGTSHYQAARDRRIAREYFRGGDTRRDWLRGVAAPFASPFDTATDILSKAWRGGVTQAHLPSEGSLAPFAVRIYDEGTGIAPHVDVLATESPSDPVAQSLACQLAANIFLATSLQGGELQLFDFPSGFEPPKDLSDGPHEYDPDELDLRTTIVPQPGDWIMFSSRRIHAVSPAQGDYGRITISFFVGLDELSEETPLQLWA